jgi:hypothetical protein
MSIKLDLKPNELASKEKLKKQFKKIRTYYDKFFINLTDLNDDDDEDQEKLYDLNNKAPLNKEENEDNSEISKNKENKSEEKSKNNEDSKNVEKEEDSE